MVPPEGDTEAVPDGPEVGRLARKEIGLHNGKLEQKRNKCQAQKNRRISIPNQWLEKILRITFRQSSPLILSRMTLRRAKRQLRRLYRLAVSFLILTFGTVFLSGYALAHALLFRIFR